MRSIKNCLWAIFGCWVLSKTVLGAFWKNGNCAFFKNSCWKEEIHKGDGEMHGKWGDRERRNTQGGLQKNAQGRGYGDGETRNFWVRQTHRRSNRGSHRGGAHLKYCDAWLQWLQPSVSSPKLVAALSHSGLVIWYSAPTEAANVSVSAPHQPANKTYRVFGREPSIIQGAPWELWEI